MANSSKCVKHIESYVSSSTSPAQQAAIVDTIAALVKNDLLTLEELVREMEMYLTTTDTIIRSRGILLLGELLTQLSLKPLTDAAIQSLIGFFIERLADWKALRGALVGCLALLRRKIDVGMITDSQAMAAAQSFLENMQVQSLGQHDRKLCFQILECLLNCYPDAVEPLGDVLVYGICESIDGEKDPQCLVLIFRIFEALARLFPHSSGSLASYAEDLFEILGCYFPIHFTHSKSEDADIKREELSQALMLAFASTPVFEPFAIPLLLEKLSSDLPSTKVESLKYLSYCTSKYGGDRMAKYFEALWSALKDVLFIRPQSTLSIEFELVDGMGFQESEIMIQALELLQMVVQRSNGSFLSFILADEDIKTFMNSLNGLKDFDNASAQNKQRLHAVGCILSASARSSFASCDAVFQNFFTSLMDALTFSVEIPSKDSVVLSRRFNFGALYLAVELLCACRCLVLNCDGLTPIPDFLSMAWCCILCGFSTSLSNSLISLLQTTSVESTPNTYVYYGVKGLQTLAMFPGSFTQVPKPIFENVLLTLMSVITTDFNKTFLWKTALKALVDIGFYVDKSSEDEKVASFESVVMEKIGFLISSNDLTVPLTLKLQTTFDIGMTGKKFMHRAVQELDKTLFDNLSQIFVSENVKSTELTIPLLDCYSKNVLPWFHDNGGSEEVSLNLAFNILEKIEKSTHSSIGFQESELLDAIMIALKHAVASCSEENQERIIKKAFDLISSGSLKDLKPYTTPLNSNGGQLTSMLEGISCRDECIISLIASVIIALRPQTHIPNLKLLLQLFLMTLLKGHILSAQALGSLVNKLPLETSIKNFNLEEAIDVLFNNEIWISCNFYDGNKCSTLDNGSAIDFSSLRINGCDVSYKIHALVGLAWIGKGLLMRGHQKIKDITSTFVSCLLSNGNVGAFEELDGQLKDNKELEVISLRKSAADAFHVLMSDSEACLNRHYHATVRPLYKQRFYNMVLPILLSSILEIDSPTTRSLLYRAFSHLISGAPLIAVVSDAKKVIPVLVDCLFMLQKDALDKDIIFSVLLVLSGILMDKNAKEAVIENAHLIVHQLNNLVSYPHMMVVRETAIQCLVALSGLPQSRIYPLRKEVLQAISKALDDPKRVVRQEAVRCRHAWLEIEGR
ncbi:PREDICTED: MMS19 nucleotide excision repair protein homolog isoform X1 [Ipomoea nil]|uniref:MMS19 nucleotide excision repair protein homolog isoform X1 n=2 Tax=Ipomoea nil TaxID=35883 RepID=UPI000900CE2C|nr:PREDICTED: MMS19 nucleotide excision repair protein homolog isoform X1 [Ipomoea nil]